MHIIIVYSKQFTDYSFIPILLNIGINNINMFQKIMHSFIRPRHPWRRLKFDELAEIYTSIMLRSLGFSLMGIFVPVFFYQSGVALDSIFLFYVFFFMFRIPVNIVSAFLVGKIGPKHSIGVSTVFQIIFLFLLLTFQTQLWSLWFLAAIYSLSNGIFFIAYHTDFSKIKDSAHGGKELSYLIIFERLGGALGPLIGGILGSFIAPEATIITAIFMLGASQIPLLFSKEPVRINQNIRFRGFPWRLFTRDYIALGAFSIDRVASIVAWPLLIAVVVFVDDTYVKLGSLVTVSTIISMLVARLFGRIIDNNKGLQLLKIGTWMNLLGHIFRPFMLNVPGVVAVSVANEPVSLAYSMPVIKGFYDQTDVVEGYRIVYISFAESVFALYKGAYWLGLFAFSQLFNPVSVLSWSYLAVGLVSLGVLFQRFPALKKV